MRKVIVVPVVIGALGAVSVNCKEYMKQNGVNLRLEVIQKTALLGTALPLPLSLPLPLPLLLLLKINRVFACVSEFDELRLRLMIVQ